MSPYPLLEGQKAVPLSTESSYPSDHLFPLPLPEFHKVPSRGSQRERARKRNSRLQLLSWCVATVNHMYFKGREQAVPTALVPASAAQYRCLDQMWTRIDVFLREIEERDPTTPLDSFPGGEDSLSAFLRCAGEDSFLGSKVTSTRVLSAASADYPAEAGGVDPVLWLKGQPVPQSILVSPEQ